MAKKKNNFENPCTEKAKLSHIGKSGKRDKENKERENKEREKKRSEQTNQENKRKREKNIAWECENWQNRDGMSCEREWKKKDQIKSKNEIEYVNKCGKGRHTRD